ncbi:OsmC family protein [Myxococcus faecalis]|uniref:OsmC family protein n=1 Tax=Myxococcus faecalis TaxID=3115646 RepID=UPI003CFB61B5
MTSVTVTEYETRLYWQGDHGAVLTSDHAPPVPIGQPLVEPGATEAGRWAPETLLVGAVEGRTLLAFLERAREADVSILFYQSCAVARLVASPGQAPHLTDLIVRPHVAVATDAEAEVVRRIFSELPAHCFPSSVIQISPRIEPVVETWHARAARPVVREPTSLALP